MNKLGSALENAITKVIIELIEVRATLNELERAFTHMDGNYYYSRKLKLTIREAELEAILERGNVQYSKEAPLEQYLVTTWK